MKISTKGRYALRMLIDLAEHEGDGFIALKDIAERQNISKKYLRADRPDSLEVGHTADEPRVSGRLRAGEGT